MDEGPGFRAGDLEFDCEGTAGEEEEEDLDLDGSVVVGALLLLLSPWVRSFSVWARRGGV